jgi:hypothetical protein
MKPLKYLFFAIVLSLNSSCNEDFLELYPEGNLNTGNFYKSTQDFQQALVGAYVPLRNVANIAFFMDEMRSDNTEYDFNPKDRGGLGFEQLADFMDDSQNGIISQRYAACYTGIARVNTILDKLDKINFAMTEADKNQIIGEAKALRAHYYFDLVRHFGKVPLHLHEVLTKEDAFLAQSSIEDVYSQIILDFTDALDKVAAPKFPQDTGRITKGMVASELSLVYITKKQFDKAVPLLTSVTKMGYSLWPNYADAFKNENKNKMESIFEVQYKDGTDGQQSNFIYRFIPIGNTKNILGIDYNNTIGGWNIPTPDLMITYETGDKRFDASIGIVEGTTDATATFIASKVVSAENYVPKPGITYKYFVKKYYHLPYLLANNTKENWPIIRYSDVLLLLAESLNETGNSSAALSFLNQVRSRAGLPNATTTAQTDLRKIIEQERRIELAFENSRWLDLVRTNQAITVLTEFGKKQKEKYSFMLPNSYNVTENRYIFPIPFREMTLNPKLIQNPGY